MLPRMHPRIDETRSTTGIAGLDAVLYGGFLAERLYLIDGDPGAGKTTLALSYLLEGVRRGETGVYVTLSETRAELAAGAASHGWSLDGLEIVELVADQQQDLDGESELTMLHPSNIELTATTRRIIAAVERSNPHRIVFDSLSELRLLAQSSLRYRRQILALKQFFAGRCCTVLMLDDRTTEGPDMQLHSIAHGVVVLSMQTPSYGKVRRQLRVLKFRGSDFVSGFHDFVIRRGGISVFPRLVAAEHAIDFERGPIASGVEALDTLLGGGAERGTSTLISGPPGCGKSTLALQYAAAATTRGDHACAYLFDETRAALLARCAGIGVRFDEGTGPGTLSIRQIDPAEVSPGEFAATIMHAVEHEDARIIIVDSLNGYLNAMQGENYLAAQLHELLSYLSNRGVTTFLVVTQGAFIGPQVSSPIDASYLADSVVLLRYFEHAGSVKKAISVLKKRTGGHEESIRQLWFDRDGIHLSEPLLQLRGVLTGVPIEVAPFAHDDVQRAARIA